MADKQQPHRAKQPPKSKKETKEKRKKGSSRPTSKDTLTIPPPWDEGNYRVGASTASKL